MKRSETPEQKLASQLTPEQADEIIARGDVMKAVLTILRDKDHPSFPALWAAVADRASLLEEDS